MPTKPGGEICQIREQIIQDSCGLTFQFEVKKGYHHGKLVNETVLRVFGESLPFGNREIFFDPTGAETAAGTSTRGLCRPAWLTKTDD
jgi:hypothetical protein